MIEQKPTQKKKHLWFILSIIIVLTGVISAHLFLKTDKEDNKMGGEPKIIEYTDNEYSYSFQFPVDWEMQRAVKESEIGEIRALVQGPGGSSGMAVIGHLETSVTKDEFNDSPKKKEIIEQMIDLTIEQVYHKASKDMEAAKMVVVEREIIESEVAIEFYISTLLSLDKGTQVIVAGVHAIPFGKDHMVCFVITGVLDAEAKEENEMLTRILNSFHLFGEKPIE